MPNSKSTRNELAVPLDVVDEADRKLDLIGSLAETIWGSMTNPRLEMKPDTIATQAHHIAEVAQELKEYIEKFSRS